MKSFRSSHQLPSSASILGERIEHSPGHNGHNVSQTATHSTQSCTMNNEEVALHNMPGATLSSAPLQFSRHEFSLGNVHSGGLGG